MSRKTISAEDDYLGEHHVYEPHRVGLPRFGPYFRELWRRRGFATELARTQMHAANTDTVLGQAWLVINPLLLASVYFLLVNVISRANRGLPFFAHLTAGLFLFTFLTGSISAGATSVTSSGHGRYGGSPGGAVPFVAHPGWRARSSPMSTAMMALTTSSSISVNARRDMAAS